MKSEKLGTFLREVSNWSWEEFVLAERDDSYTTNESIIFALIRSCAMQKMDAIKMSLNRLDGKLKTPVQIEYPRIYFIYPNAKALTSGETPLEIAEGELIEAVITDLAVVEEEKDLPSMTLRETLSKMSDYPRQIPEAIVEQALLTEQWMRGQAENPGEIPRVKSVVAAHLLLMAQKRDIGALTEVFDQLDGKLVETVQILGDDIYITNYSDTAPDGAILNKNGVLQLEATIAQNLWAEKLAKGL